jgi:hypothetical protein
LLHIFHVSPNKVSDKFAWGIIQSASTRNFPNKSRQRVWQRCIQPFYNLGFFCGFGCFHNKSFSSFCFSEYPMCARV